MSLSQSTAKTLPAETQSAWEDLVLIRPEPAYLAGGTAIAVHLGHRVSRDLDFFLSEAVDMDQLLARLHRTGHFVETQLAMGTINGMLGSAKVQFLLADDQVNTEPLTMVDGLPIAGLGDLLATKLKVVMDRGELRDYFDIMTIEQRTPLRTEEGLGIFLERYQPKAPDAALAVIVRALGSMSDVQDDPAVPVKRAVIENYWARRQKSLLVHLQRSTYSAPPEDDTFRGLTGLGPLSTPRPVSNTSARKAQCPHTTNLKERCRVWLLPGSVCPAHHWQAPK